MNQSKFIVMLLAFVVVGVVVAGCLADNLSGSDNRAELTVTRSDSSTIIVPLTGQPITPIATKTEQLAGVLPTVSPTVQISSRPTSTPFPPISPTLTATPLLPIVWAEAVEQAANIRGVDSGSIVWSPVANEFIVHDCWSALHNQSQQQSIFHLTAPDFSRVDITPVNFFCEPVQEMIWSVDATYILFSGPFPEDHSLHPSNYGWDNSAIWIIDRTGSNSYPLNLDQAWGRYLNFRGWMDEHTLVYTAYAGGGSYYTAMLDVESGEPISWAMVHSGGGYQPGQDYIGTNTGMGFDGHITAVAVSKTMVNPETIFDGGPFLFCVSRFCHGNPPDKPPLLDNNSRFEDWLPGTNKMLLLTWNAGEKLGVFAGETRELRLNRHIETQLQLWDVDLHEVSMLVPQGRYGRFSPDGQYLAFNTFAVDTIGDESKNQLHVLRLADEQVILSLPSAEPVIDYRLIPGHVWSPTSERLVYQDEQHNWQIVQLPDGTQTLITLSSGERLSSPQWSSDGQYLSMTVRGESEEEVVILRVP